MYKLKFETRFILAVARTPLLCFYFIPPDSKQSRGILDASCSFWLDLGSDRIGSSETSCTHELTFYYIRIPNVSKICMFLHDYRHQYTFADSFGRKLWKLVTCYIKDSWHLVCCAPWETFIILSVCVCVRGGGSYRCRHAALWKHLALVKHVALLWHVMDDWCIRKDNSASTSVLMVSSILFISFVNRSKTRLEPQSTRLGLSKKLVCCVVRCAKHRRNSAIMWVIRLESWLYLLFECCSGVHSGSSGSTTIHRGATKLPSRPAFIHL